MTDQLPSDAAPAPVAREGTTPRMSVLKFVSDDGRTVELEPHDGRQFDVKPLSFAELVYAAETTNPTFAVSLGNARAPVSETGLEKDGPLTVNTTMSNNGPVIAFGLVKGGWLPMPWAHKRVAWVDRNVVIALEKLKGYVEAAANPGDPAWLAQWLGVDTDEVSPILFALEGSQRRTPTDFDMRAELTRASKALERLMPGAKIQTVNPQQRKALLRLVLDNAESRARATRLLMQAAPLVVQREKPERRGLLETKVLDLARQEGVKPSSLTVLALLSCIYDANPTISTHRAATPGRAVLKPKATFTREDAYNALTDLYFVELMLNAHAAFPDIQPVLYTRDVGIAAMWTVLQPGELTTEHLPQGRFRTTTTFNLTTGLFPALSDSEVIDLKGRLLL